MQADSIILSTTSMFSSPNDAPPANGEAAVSQNMIENHHSFLAKNCKQKKTTSNV